MSQASRQLTELQTKAPSVQSQGKRPRTSLATSYGPCQSCKLTANLCDELRPCSTCTDQGTGISCRAPGQQITACLSCNQLKRKCDKAKPECGWCSKWSKPCSFNPNFESSVESSKNAGHATGSKNKDSPSLRSAAGSRRRPEPTSRGGDGASRTEPSAGTEAQSQPEEGDGPPVEWDDGPIQWTDAVYLEKSYGWFPE